MALDPQAKAVVNIFNDIPAEDTLTPTDMRLIMKQKRDEIGHTVKIEDVETVEEIVIPSADEEIRLRIYRPNKSEALPALVYFHGGGWVIGNLDTTDNVCRQIANSVPCVVVSVDYRLAPEHKFPTAVEDAYTATKWVADHAQQIQVDPKRIAVGGDSAGANLAAVVTHMARDQAGPPLVFQVLVYPNTKFSFDTPSFQRFGEGYYLTKTRLEWFKKHYLRNPDDMHNEKAAPLLSSRFNDLPPAILITAEYDPLTDEGEEYASKLRDAGISVKSSLYKGMIHGFFSMPMEKSKKAVDEVSRALSDVFNRK